MRVSTDLDELRLDPFHKRLATQERNGETLGVVVRIFVSVLALADLPEASVLGGG